MLYSCWLDQDMAPPTIFSQKPPMLCSPSLNFHKNDWSKLNFKHIWPKRPILGCLTAAFLQKDQLAIKTLSKLAPLPRGLLKFAPQSSALLNFGYILSHMFCLPLGFLVGCWELETCRPTFRPFTNYYPGKFPTTALRTTSALRNNQIDQHLK